MADLFILSIGVEPTLTANGERDWYAQDAEYVRQALVRAEPLYDTVHSRVLNGDRATRARVLQALDWLARSVNRTDVVVFFLSGHGDVDPDQGYQIHLAASATQGEGKDVLWG